MNRPVLVLVGLLGLAGLSCDAGPKAGEIPFDYVTPQNDDRAIMFKVTATIEYMITGIVADCAGCQVFSHKVSDTDWRGILTGVPGNGPAIRVAVSDREAANAYAVTLLRVAGAEYRLRSTIDRRLQRPQSQ